MVTKNQLCARKPMVTNPQTNFTDDWPVGAEGMSVKVMD
jgi:hypothetical protein